MPRDIYEKTIALPDATGVIKALQGVELTVYLAGTTTLATIYQRRTGVTQGPAPETGATGGPNPFITSISGAVEFWAEGPIEYDVKYRDTLVPARITERTRGWNAMPVGDASIPASMLGLSFTSIM